MDERRRVKWLKYEKGRIYFSRQTERKIFFIMTLVMLLVGIIIKI